MIVRHRLILFVISLFTLSAKAAPGISQQRAMEKAKAFLEQHQHHGAKTRSCQTFSLAAVETGMAHIHAFNASDDGFVIVSANGDSPAILGYNDTGRIDSDNMPPALKRLLESYDIQPAVAGTRADGAISGIKSDIQPMLTTRWAQDKPYNDMTPPYTGDDGKEYHCPIGCVATAMAQVLYYYQWPKRTTATIPAYDEGEALAPVDFRWDAMQDIYDATASQASQDAVAVLMQYCAFALRSSFGIISTASNTEWLYRALYRYFSFDRQQLSILKRSHVDENEFFNAVYSELSQGHPVIMGGDAHEFVCDGYQANYFHINWGWEGNENGYFLLDSRTRSDNAYVGRAKHFPDEALIGMRKTTTPYSGELKAALTTIALQLDKPIAGPYTRTGDTDFPAINLLYGFQNYTDDGSKTFDAGLALYQNGEFLKLLYELKDVEVIDNSKEMARDVSVTFGQGLADGSYDIMPVSRKSGSSDWLPNEDAKPFYIHAAIASDQMSLTVYPRSLSYIVNSITFEGQLMAGEPVKAIANVTNPNQNHIQTTIILCGGLGTDEPEFCYNYEGIGAGETKDLVFEFIPQEAGTWTCYLWNDKCFFGEGAQLVVKEQESPYAVDKSLKLACSVKTDEAEKSGEGYVLYGHVMNSVVTFKNPSADYAFSGKLEVILRLQGSRGDSLNLEKVEKNVCIEPNGTYEIPYYSQRLQTGQSYTLYASENPNDNNLIVSYTTVAAISAYLADGSIKTARNITDYTVPANALCVELADQGVTRVTPNANPNCLYILNDEDQMPEGITEKNVIRCGKNGAVADELELSDDYEFMTPLSFVARRASYVRTFKSQECGGYTTLALPFTATAITAGNKPVSLRLLEYAGDQPGKVFVSEVSDGIPQGGVPYLLEVTDQSLAGQPVTFTGQNTDVFASISPQVAGNYQFVGTLTAMRDDTAELFAIERGQAAISIPLNKECTAFRACFKSLCYPGQYQALSIDNTSTGIADVRETPSSSEILYDLQGHRLNGQPTHGIYIKGNRKVLIK